MRAGASPGSRLAGRRGRAIARALSTALALALRPPSAGAEGAVGQAVSIDLSQRATARVIREDGPVNAANALGLSEWAAEMRADADWDIDIAGRLALCLSPAVAWTQDEGSFDGWSPVEAPSGRGEARIELERAEARLSFREIGLQAIFGRLRPGFGANYIEPLSSTRPLGRAGRADGRWMAGLFLSAGDLALEAYCETARDPLVVAALSALLGSSEAGLSYERGPASEGSAFGAWWRGQLGDGLLAYAECALREDGDFIDIAGLPSRNEGWNAGATAGLGFTPRGIGASFYAEYRYRQAGYSEGDYEALAALPLPAQAAVVAGLPYLQTARHALGVHARSDSPDDGLSWSATCLYLLPDGLRLSAAVEAGLAGPLAVGTEASAAAPLSGPGRARSEISFWPEAWSLAAYLRWSVDAAEEE